MTHLSEQLKTVQEALQELVTNSGFYTEERFCLAKHALSLLPAIIEGVKGMEVGVDEKELERIANEHDMNVPDDLLASPHGFGIHKPSLKSALEKIINPCVAMPPAQEHLCPRCGESDYFKAGECLACKKYVPKVSADVVKAAFMGGWHCGTNHRTSTEDRDWDRSKAKANLVAIQHPEREK